MTSTSNTVQPIRESAPKHLHRKWWGFSNLIRSNWRDDFIKKVKKILVFKNKIGLCFSEKGARQRLGKQYSCSVCGELSRRIRIQIISISPHNGTISNDPMTFYKTNISLIRITSQSIDYHDHRGEDCWNDHLLYEAGACNLDWPGLGMPPGGLSKICFMDDEIDFSILLTGQILYQAAVTAGARFQNLRHFRT